jgi:hypothetical protein
MPAVSHLKRPKLIQASVEVEGETVSVTFDRNRVTLAWAAEVKKAREAWDPDALARTSADVIADWDITNDDGTPFPPTPENLASLPTTVMGRLSDAIAEAATPSESEGKDSSQPPETLSSTSSPLQRTHPNGEVISTSPSVSASPSPT